LIEKVRGIFTRTVLDSENIIGEYKIRRVPEIKNKIEVNFGWSNKMVGVTAANEWIKEGGERNRDQV